MKVSVNKLKSIEPLVSVIIVSYNGKKWLDSCIDSLQNQTYSNTEIILVDNDSLDGSFEYVNNKYKDVKVFSKKNEGYGLACNFGAKKANGMFLMFFNEDMYVETNFIQKFIDYYQKVQSTRTVGTIGCRIDNYDKSRYYSFDYYGYKLDLLSQPTPNKQNNYIFYNSGCPFFIAKNTFIKVGGFCPNIFLYSEDIDLCWRLNIFGYKHYFINDISVYHKGGGVTGTFSSKKIAYYFTGEINTILNNYSFLALVVVLPLYFMYYLVIATYFILTFQIDYIKSLSKVFIITFTKNLKPMLAFRKFVQENRVVPEISILRRITIFPSRIINIYLK